MIAEQLDFNVTRSNEKPLEINRRVAEGRARFGACSAHG
jgi:hypothetical protein